MFAKISTAGLGKKARVAQSYIAMEHEEGIQTFLKHSKPKAAAQNTENQMEEENKRVDYVPIKIQNNAAIYFCRKVKKCRHQCLGVKGESKCLPCLEPECIDQKSRVPPKTDMCSICYTCELSEEPSVELLCGHVFHANCVRQLLQHKWSTLRITFAFMDCPSCKRQVSASHCSPIKKELDILFKLKAYIEQEAMHEAQKLGMDKEERLTTPGDYYHNRLLDYALHRCSFYECGNCLKPYFGGLIDCEEEMELMDGKTKEDFLCTTCQLEAFGVGNQNCPTHGTDFIAWKCMYCCSEALFICGGGSHYYCDNCHSGNKLYQDCHGVNCPLGVPHPPPSDNVRISAWPLGCSACRADKINLFTVEQGDYSHIQSVGQVDFTQITAQQRQQRLALIADKALRALRQAYELQQQKEAQEQKRIQQNLQALEVNRKKNINTGAAVQPKKSTGAASSIQKATVAAPAKKSRVPVGAQAAGQQQRVGARPANNSMRR